MKVADIMVKQVHAVGPQEAVRAIALTMLARGISGVPVVDAGGRVLGVVSEGDLIRRPEIGTERSKSGWLEMLVADEGGAREFVKTHGLCAREVMTQPAITVAPEASLVEAVRLMQKHGVKRLPVVENGRLVGMLSRADLVRLLAMEPRKPAPARDDAELRERIVGAIAAQPWAGGAMVHVEVEQGVARIWGSVDSAAQREALLVAVREVPGVKAVEPHLVQAMPGWC